MVNFPDIRAWRNLHGEIQAEYEACLSQLQSDDIDLGTVTPTTQTSGLTLKPIYLIGIAAVIFLMIKK